MDDESNVPQNQPSDSVSFHLVNEREDVPTKILEEENAEPALDPPLSVVERLFAQGFEGEEEDFSFVSEKPPLATLPMSPVAPAASRAAIPRDEVGPSIGGGMKQVIIEVPGSVNLLRKPNRAVVWLKPLIGPFERKTLDSHSSTTLINDVIHSGIFFFSYFFPPFLRFVTYFSSPFCRST